MSEPQPPAPWQPPAHGQPPTGYGPPPGYPGYQQPGYPGYQQPGYPAYPQYSGYPGQGLAAYPGGPGSIGQVRGTGISILLSIVTLGIYNYVWYYKVHEEMKRHTGNGLGGGIALLIALLAGIAMPYITSSEVGGLYSRRGQRPPVTGLTGLWYCPGFLLLFIGPLIWFIKTNDAINAYWRSVGAPG
jgi:hypothetical protein